MEPRLNSALIEVPDEHVSGYRERHDCIRVTLALEPQGVRVAQREPLLQ